MIYVVSIKKYCRIKQKNATVYYVECDNNIAFIAAVICQMHPKFGHIRLMTNINGIEELSLRCREAFELYSCNLKEWSKKIIIHESFNDSRLRVL